jgi:hypothetical protein
LGDIIDISPTIRRMTYAALAEVRGISPASRECIARAEAAGLGAEPEVLGTWGLRRLSWALGGGRYGG